MLGGSALANPALAAEVPAPGVMGTVPVTPGEIAEPDEPEPTPGEIVVVANRVRGAVDVPQPPIQTLTEADIASYGATSISDLVAQLGPQANSGRGRGSGGMPVVLVNGQRIASFREMRNYPPEAIQRMEILPEEVALRFGYPPNQRVINFILKDKFAAKTLEAEYDQPGRGGSSTKEFEASLFRVAGQSRLNLTASAQDTTPLTEAGRGVLQAPGSVPTVAGDPDPAAARTLIADSREIGVNVTWTTGLGEKGLDGAVTLNGAFTRNDSTSYSGLNLVTLIDPQGATALRTFGDPLARRTRTDTAEGGATFARSLGAWQLTATLDAAHAVSNTLIDGRAAPADIGALQAAALAGTLAITGPLPVVAPGGGDLARRVSDSATSLVTLVGKAVSLPAGDVTTTFKAGFAWTGIVSSDTRTALGETQLRRGDASVGVNLGIPIASRRNDVLAGIGDFSLNFSAGLDRLSDFGWLTDWSGGLTWGITPALTLQASYIVNQAAPALTDLGNPAVLTYNVPVYDFARGETVLVTRTSGGNPALVRETQRDLKLGLDWQLPVLRNSSLIVEYFRNNSDNVTAAFPLLTPAIEAAFPGRVTRDPLTGALLAIDGRPVTFAGESSSRMRSGFNLSGSLGKPTPGATGGPQRFGGGRGGNGQGRWNLSLFHTVRFTDRVTVAPGGPVLDLLGGDALTGGGAARHSFEFEGGGFYRGLGVRLNGNWAAPTHVNGSGLPGSSDLRFGALTKLNFRLFADLGQQKALTDASPFFKGARMSFRINNMLDSRQKVTDQFGVVPISYQPDLLDPQGRTISIELRKQF
ncbi:MAG: TonB-dependent receptor [Sphingomonadales bacterium]|nr:TonB-dependent receptor [Sphingomonadales bacterium]MBU3991619.1 TonB-dependent receptor [Alphaproteobacteria bacterium]